MAAISAKQKTFCDEYLIDLNATQAAIRAGYSEKTAYSQGQRLLKKVELQKRIQELQNRRAKRTEITQDRVLEELAKTGFSNLRAAITPDGYLVNPQDWDDNFAGAVASLEVVASNIQDDEGKPVSYTHKIKLWDKMSALEKLGKHLGMFTTKLDVTTGGDKIEQASLDVTKLSPDAMREILKAHDDTESG